MLIRILFLTTVSLAIIKSLLSVSPNLLQSQDYWAQLTQKEGQLQAACTPGQPLPINTKRELADILWQENRLSEAEKIMREIWQSDLTERPTGYDNDFAKDALMLAGIYIDQGAFDNAKYCYESMLAYESGRLGSSAWQVSRDLNGLGVVAYIAGQTASEPQKRNASFTRAFNYYSQAASVCSRADRSQLSFWRLNCILENRALAWRDLRNLPQTPIDSFKSSNTCTFKGNQ